MDDSTRPTLEIQGPQGPSPLDELLGEVRENSPVPAPRSGSKRKLLAFALVAAAGVAAALGPGRSLWSSPAATRGSAMHRAARTRLPVTFTARGSVESSKNRDLINQVEGQTTILYIIPDGTTVKKGDLLCELDSYTLREKMTTERITISQAEADGQNAAKTREVAEFALREYQGGTYPQERLAADIALKLAETNLHQAAERFDWSTRMYALGFVARSQTVADRDSKANTEITLDRSRTKIDVMERFTRRKTIIELEAAVQKARSDELSWQAKLALEKSKLKKYETMIERCKLYAPIDGLVVHANDAMSRRGSEQEMIQEGVMVREGQAILRIPDVRAMRMNAKFDESVLSHIAPGQPARVQIDALPGLQLDGRVVAVQSMADSTGRDLVDVRLYTGLISIENAPTSLRPGMTARVEVLASEAVDVLAVPLSSVVQVQGENYVYVATPDGPTRRGVRLGGSNAELIEIVEGLQEGEAVALDPLAVMSPREQHQAFAAAAQGVDDWR